MTKIDGISDDVVKAAKEFRKNRKYRLAAESEDDADVRAMKAAIQALLSSGAVVLRSDVDELVGALFYAASGNDELVAQIARNALAKFTATNGGK